MNIRLGTVKGMEIRKNRDSKLNSRMLNVEISSPDDTQSVELINGNGEDFNPENNEKVLVIPISDAYKIGLLIDDNVEPDPSVLKGEKEFYSKKDGIKKAKLKLDEDGQVILNGGADFAVLYNELKTQVDKLKVDLLAHFHPGITPGPGVTGVSATLFSFNVDAAKAEKVRI